MHTFDLACPGSLSSDAKPRVDKGLRSQQTKRGRGRPRKGDTSSSLQKGRKQEDPTSSKKPRGRKKKVKPGSVPIRGDNVNLQPQLCSPQNGEGLLPHLVHV